MRDKLKRNPTGLVEIGGDRRAGARRRVQAASTLRGPDNQAIDVTVSELSPSGFRVRLQRPLEIGSVVQLGLPGEGRFAARIVRRDGDSYGCEFFDYLDPQRVGDAFSQDTVTQMFVTPEDWHVPEPEVRKWARPVRGWILLGGASAAWAAILWAALA